LILTNKINLERASWRVHQIVLWDSEKSQGRW